jgi:PAS domain S-box-containing protein
MGSASEQVRGPSTSGVPGPDASTGADIKRPRSKTDTSLGWVRSRGGARTIMQVIREHEPAQAVDPSVPAKQVPTEALGSAGSARLRFAWKIYLIFGVAAMIGHYFTAGALQPIVYDIIGASALGAVVLGIRWNRPASPLGWWLLAAGQGAFLCGDITWNYFQYVRHVELPSPSGADAMYLVGYPLIFYGLWRLMKDRRAGKKGLREGLIDALIVAAAVTAITWILILDKQETQIFHSGSVFVGVLYLVMDLFLVGVLARLLFSPGRRSASFRFLAGSILCLIVSDIAYAALLSNAGSLAGSLTSAGWLLSYLLLGAAALHPSMTEAMESTGEEERRLSRSRLITLGVITLIPSASLLVANRVGTHVDATDLAFFSGFLFVLVILRMSLLLQEIEGAAVVQRRLATIVENSPDAIFMTGSDGTILSWNPGAETIYGYSAEDVISKSWADVVTGAEADAAPSTEALTSGTGALEHTSSRRRKDGAEVHVSVITSPIPDGLGGVAGSSTIERDITRKVEAEREVAELQRTRRKLLGRTIEAAELERKRLAADIHDGPVQHLTALTVNLHVIRRRLKYSDNVSNEKVDQVQDGLSNSIRELRQIMVELHPPALKERGLDAAILDSLKEIGEHSKVRCHLQSTLADRSGPYLETTLYRIFQEAINNVIRHARAENAWIELHETDGWVEMSVKDDGVGIKNKPASATASGEYFGLIGMRERAEMLGGTCEVTSVNEGGTMVKVRLPKEEKR